MSKHKKNKDLNHKDENVMVVKDNVGKDVKVPLNNKQLAEILYDKRFNVKAKNNKQKEFLRLIDQNEITFAVGCSGVGKSYLAIGKALELLKRSDNSFQYIYIITPVVEAEEKLGFLPGELEEKLAPYLYSTYYLIDKLIGIDNRKKLIADGIIRPIALAYLRGVNIDNSILVFEEAQNATPGQMKTVLTRIGFNSKFIITGDLEQSDRYKIISDSGLYQVFNMLKNEQGIATFEWVIEDENEIVRNPIIGRILRKYNNGKTIRYGTSFDDKRDDKTE